MIDSPVRPHKVRYNELCFQTLMSVRGTARVITSVITRTVVLSAPAVKVTSSTAEHTVLVYTC